MHRYSGYKLRPPSPALRQQSRPPFTNLTIRTPDQPAPMMPQPAPSSSSSSAQQQRTVYPIPIPARKLEKALRLYATYRTARALAQREAAAATAHPDNPFLNVPNTPIAHSVTSGGSSRHHGGTSISTSMYEATDMTSVLSFNESPSTAHELTSFNGQKVRQRHRRQFDPVGRARTALVRWLGSCPRCHSRRVPCQLEEHHDIATLERMYMERRSDYHPQSRHPSRSSVSDSSQRTARSPSERQPNPPAASHTDFLGMGQNPNLLTPYSSVNAPSQDVQSPGGYADPLADIFAPVMVANPLYETPAQPSLSPDPYITYQDRDMLVIGLQQNGYFLCQHLEGCQEYFEDADTLQTHFEFVHFPFTRINPAHRYICASCNMLNNFPSGRCQACSVHDRIQMWIYGNFIRNLTYRSTPSGGPAPLMYSSSSTPYYPAAYTSQNTESQWGSGNGFGSSANSGPYANTAPDSNTYGGPSTQGYGYSAFNSSDFGGDRFQGNGYRSAQMAAGHSFSVRGWYSIATQNCRRRKMLLLFSLLFVTMMFGYTHDSVISKARAALPRAGSGLREHLPKVGFVGIFLSFGVSFLTKHSSVDTPSSSLSSRCSLRAFIPYPTRYRQTAPNTYVQCGGYL